MPPALSKRGPCKNLKNYFNICTIKSFIELQHQSSWLKHKFHGWADKHIVKKYMCILFTTNDYWSCQDSILTLTLLWADSGTAQ